jgi:hypothetical protein
MSAREVDIQKSAKQTAQNDLSAHDFSGRTLQNITLKKREPCREPLEDPAKYIKDPARIEKALYTQKRQKTLDNRSNLV